MTKALTEVTILPVVCFSCRHENPEKHIRFDMDDNVEKREAAKQKAMTCDRCGFDNYKHNLVNLGIEE